MPEEKMPHEEMPEEKMPLEKMPEGKNAIGKNARRKKCHWKKCQWVGISNRQQTNRQTNKHPYSINVNEKIITAKKGIGIIKYLRNSYPLKLLIKCIKFWSVQIWIIVILYITYQPQIVKST